MAHTQEELQKLLYAPLPQEALKQHPTKKFLTTINAAFVIERLNNTFGIGKWMQTTEIVEQNEKMVVLKAVLLIPEYDISIETYGGNDNPDRGDAYKGAQTDALTKAASILGIGLHVWKNEKQPQNDVGQVQASKPTKTTTQVQKTQQESKFCQIEGCGQEMVYKEGVAKSGKPYRAWLCSGETGVKDRKHTIFLKD